ncbi:hypothetical protein DPMN_192552 [Dreissena polymorpha]|uniref:Uncharacterized protein n=1 Tax=Dreissena polymorpha TaxID=45954 RepID=A0A9D4B8H0_DREPO|nr:hypothetical protein DPMN_192552 [Dreissena polymorpha]
MDVTPVSLQCPFFQPVVLKNKLHVLDIPCWRYCGDNCFTLLVPPLDDCVRLCQRLLPGRERPHIRVFGFFGIAYGL